MHWFKIQWKKHKLHKIKAKSIPTKQFTAAQENNVQTWFKQYQKVLKDLEIRRKKNIINFDEASFRVGCLKGYEILVPVDVKKVYI